MRSRCSPVKTFLDRQHELVAAGKAKNLSEASLILTRRSERAVVRALRKLRYA
jgi:hypothetical protein